MTRPLVSNLKRPPAEAEINSLTKEFIAYISNSRDSVIISTDVLNIFSKEFQWKDYKLLNPSPKSLPMTKEKFLSDYYPEIPAGSSLDVGSCFKFIDYFSKAFFDSAFVISTMDDYAEREYFLTKVIDSILFRLIVFTEILSDRGNSKFSTYKNVEFKIDSFEELRKILSNTFNGLINELSDKDRLQSSFCYDVAFKAFLENKDISWLCQSEIQRYNFHACLFLRHDDCWEKIELVQKKALTVLEFRIKNLLASMFVRKIKKTPTIFSGGIMLAGLTLASSWLISLPIIALGVSLGYYYGVSTFEIKTSELKRLFKSACETYKLAQPSGYLYYRLKSTNFFEWMKFCGVDKLKEKELIDNMICSYNTSKSKMQILNVVIVAYYFYMEQMHHLKQVSTISKEETTVAKKRAMPTQRLPTFVEPLPERLTFTFLTQSEEKLPEPSPPEDSYMTWLKKGFSEKVFSQTPMVQHRPPIAVEEQQLPINVIKEGEDIYLFVFMDDGSKGFFKISAVILDKVSQECVEVINFPQKYLNGEYNNIIRAEGQYNGFKRLSVGGYELKINGMRVYYCRQEGTRNVNEEGRIIPVPVYTYTSHEKKRS